MKNNFFETMKYKIQKALGRALPAVFTIAAALAVGAIIIAISGNNPFEAYRQLLKGAFGNANRISETLTKTIPLLILALGTSIAFRSQIWNIGGEGQFTMGAIFAISVVMLFPQENPLVFALSLFAGAAGGALWVGVAGFLRSHFQANEVITTLMLNYIAAYLLNFLITGPLQDPHGGGSPQSAGIPVAFQLPRFVSGMRVHYGIFIALLVLLAVFFFWRSTTGFRIKLVGASQAVSKYAGINVRSTILLTMILSGGLAGLAGWTEVFGVQYRLLDGISSGYGNLAIVVALLGGLRPIGIGVSSFFFAALLVGGSTMQRLGGIPYSVVDIIQGLVIVFVICRSAWSSKQLRAFLKERFGKKGAKTC